MGKKYLAFFLTLYVLCGILSGCDISLLEIRENGKKDKSSNSETTIKITARAPTLPETDPLFDPSAPALDTQIDLITYGLKFNLPADWSIVSSDRLSTYLLSADQNTSLTVIHDLKLIDGAPPTFDDPSVLYEDLSFLLPTQCIRAPINGKTGYAVDYWPTPNKTQFEKFETESLFLNSKMYLTLDILDRDSKDLDKREAQSVFIGGILSGKYSVLFVFSQSETQSDDLMPLAEAVYAACSFYTPYYEPLSEDQKDLFTEDSIPFSFPVPKGFTVEEAMGGYHLTDRTLTPESPYYDMSISVWYTYTDSDTDYGRLSAYLLDRFPIACYGVDQMNDVPVDDFDFNLMEQTRGLDGRYEEAFNIPAGTKLANRFGYSYIFSFSDYRDRYDVPDTGNVRGTLLTITTNNKTYLITINAPYLTRNVRDGIVDMILSEIAFED